MPVLKEIPVRIDPVALLRALNRNRVSAPLRAEAEKAVARAETLIAAAVVWDWWAVCAVKQAAVFVARDPVSDTVRLEIGPHADLLARARCVLVSVLTIGARLDAEVRRLQQAGEPLGAYLLDSAGVVGLSQVGDRVRELAETAAADRGWGVGVSLSPGSLMGWPLAGQRDLCALLLLERIAVRLNEAGILIPFKSVTSVIGIGPDYTDRRVGSVCCFCGHAATCWRRRDAAPPLEPPLADPGGKGRTPSGSATIPMRTPFRSGCLFPKFS